MNHRQKNVLKCVAAAFIIMFLFPPFHIVAMRATVNEGYSFIFSPPQAAAIIDTEMLLIQLFLVLVVGGIAYALVTGKKT